MFSSHALKKMTTHSLHIQDRTELSTYKTSWQQTSSLTANRNVTGMKTSTKFWLAVTSVIPGKHKVLQFVHWEANLGSNHVLQCLRLRGQWLCDYWGKKIHIEGPIGKLKKTKQKIYILLSLFLILKTFNITWL